MPSEPPLCLPQWRSLLRCNCCESATAVAAMYIMPKIPRNAFHNIQSLVGLGLQGKRLKAFTGTSDYRTPIEESLWPTSQAILTVKSKATGGDGIPDQISCAIPDTWMVGLPHALLQTASLDQLALSELSMQQLIPSPKASGMKRFLQSQIAGFGLEYDGIRSQLVLVSTTGVRQGCRVAVL
eukprot:4873891-Amphidinium_carterae.1